MNHTNRSPGRAWLLALLLVAPLAPLATGCLTAAVATAGAAAGIAYTHRGAKSEVQGTVPEVNQKAEAVFRDLGLAQTEAKQSAGKNKLVGQRGDLRVEVRMNAAGAQFTQVEVTAHRSVVSWDKEYARDIMQRIIRA